MRPDSFLKITFLLIVIISIISCAGPTGKELSPKKFLILPLEISKIILLQKKSEYYFHTIHYYVDSKYLYFISPDNTTVEKIDKNLNVIFKKVCNTNLFSTNISLFLKKHLTTLVFPSRIISDLNQNIIIENVLNLVTEQYSYTPASTIFLFSPDGKLKEVFLKDKKYYIPFSGVEGLSLDVNNNIYVKEQITNTWIINKIDTKNKIIKIININNILKKFLPANSQYGIENIEPTRNGENLICGVALFEENMEFKGLKFYQISIKNKKVKYLFKVKKEDWHFVGMDIYNIIYLWETDAEERKIKLHLYNLTGNYVGVKTISLEKLKGTIIDLKIQRNGIITGLRLQKGKLLIEVWK